MKILILSLLFFLSVTHSAQDVPKILEVSSGTNSSNSSTDSTAVSTETFNWKKSLIILDGVEISHKQLKTMNSEEYESMMNLKPELAVKRYGQKAKYGTVIITKKSTGKTLKENDPDADGAIFSKAEVMPDYPGGINAVRTWISNNLVYPRQAQVKGIEGKVFVSFVINTKGIVVDVKLAQQGPDIDLEKEALRVVSQIPPYWKPGMNRGKAVNVLFIVPVVFSSRY